MRITLIAFASGRLGAIELRSMHTHNCLHLWAEVLPHFHFTRTPLSNRAGSVNVQIGTGAKESGRVV